MTHLQKSFRDKLLDQLIGFLWRQWTSLGVPGNRASQGNLVIDPEALILITTTFSRYDARLCDLSLDWLHDHGRWINLQRLKSLWGQWPNADERVLSAFAEVLSEQSALRKWNSLREKWPLFKDDNEEPLFISKNETTVPILGNPDPRFRRFGLLRSDWKPRGDCAAPSPNRPANLIFMLRALFGVNARAEIMAWLLTHEWGTPSAIAGATGYFSKTVQQTLNEMEASGQLRSAIDGRKKRFWLQRNDWVFLIQRKKPTSYPQWINWSPIFYFIKRTLDLLETSAEPGASERLRAIQQRGFLDEVIPRLNMSTLRHELSAHRDLKGESLTEAILKDVKMLERQLETDFSESTSEG